ncbi:MAG: SNF2-related protein [Bacteroidales bacterium]|nr:SNF2-related protein [Bacteroidales bacterium]
MSPLKKISHRGFVIILGRHRLWGSIFLPWIVEKEEGSEYYSPVECLSPYASPAIMDELTEAETDLTELINSYSDPYLFRLFSRERTVVVFTEKISGERFEKHIKPYIERKLYKCFEIINTHSIPVYWQKTGTSNLHPEDRLNICKTGIKPLFTFEKGSEETKYILELFINGNKIDLLEGEIEILCNYPCLIRYNDRLVPVDEIEGSKLMPFLQKKEVRIPGNHNKKYFSGFVRKLVNTHTVKALGFEIKHITPDPSASLSLDKGLRNIAVLILKFEYEGIKIFHNDLAEAFTIFEEEPGYVFKKISRDRKWEQACIEKLNKLGFYSDDNVNFTVASQGGEAREELYSLIEWLNYSYNELLAEGFSINHGSLDKKYNLKPISLNINYEVSNDWFDLKAKVVINGEEIPFINFRKNILEGKREYMSSDGTVIVLPEEWFARYSELLELGQTDKNIIKLHKQHFSLLNDIFNEEECHSCPALEKLVIPDSIPDVRLPNGLKAEMRDYQKEGLRWLSFLQDNNLGGCLADDMGLGKTIQTLALMQLNKEKNDEISPAPGGNEPDLFSDIKKGLTSLLIVPASLISNWENEIRKFTPSLKTYSYKGNNRKKSTRYFNEYDIILSSYHTIRQDIEIISAFNFYYIVLDESQVIKNPASQLYKTISHLKSEHKLVLTGTPVENSLTDLWTQFNFVNKGLLGSLVYFNRQFAKPIEKEQSVEREERLLRLIKPFILRRTKEEVTHDLPPVSENMVYCNMSEDQHKKYEEEKSVVRNSILETIEKNGEEKSAIIVLQGLMKLRQISNHPVLADPDYRSDSGKFENVLHDIESVISEGHKILVFSSFVRHLDLFAREFDTGGLKYSLLTGSSTKRGDIVEGFQSDKDINIFLISLKAGGLGLNLTAADYVFILDPWWNPSAELQALSRAHRIGQDKNVFVKRYITSNSIEEKIVKLQEKKSRLAETFISTNNPLREIEIKDILDLIG